MPPPFYKRGLTALICVALGSTGITPARSYAQATPSSSPPASSSATHAGDALPSLGDPASADLSPAAERKLGERVMREIRRDPDYLPDPVLTDYLNRIESRLTEHLARYAEDGAPLAMEMFVVRDRTVNAFALPGGFIGIHTGLLNIAKTESELASVMAHESSHVAQRHIARSISKQSQTSMAALAAMVLGVLAASKNPDAASAVIAFGQGAAVQGQLNFSRDMEREADRIGFSLLNDATYSTPAMLAFFERLQSVNRINDNGSYPYLRSHPLTSERIGDMRSRLGAVALKPAGIRQATQSLPDYAEFALMVGRARILTESSTEGVRSQSTACAAQAARNDLSESEALSAIYCAAFGAAKLRNTAQQEAMQAQLNDKLKSLPAMHQARRILTLLQAESAVLAATEGQASARAGAALALLAPLRAADPLNRPVTLLQADAALAARTPEAYASARESLQSWVVLNRHDAAAWALLGRVQSNMGEASAALRSSAEGAMLDEQWRNAVDLLERARKTPGITYFDASIIDSRLRNARERLKEEMEETRGKRSAPGSPES